jgi:ADP-heptose:LPS heptosyltransferase
MIIISPYSKKLLSGKRNPKDYPYWQDLLKDIPGPVVQVGVQWEEQLVEDFRKNLSLEELKVLIKQCDTWISCDSFFQHLGWDQGKRGVVLWSVSDPLIFGHPENINLLKDRSCLAENQFLWWEHVDHVSEKFVEPQVVIESLNNLLAEQHKA